METIFDCKFKPDDSELLATASFDGTIKVWDINTLKPVSCIMVVPLSYFSFQPVLHEWCNKGCGMCYPVCGMVHIKEPLLLIEKSSPFSGGSGFDFYFLCRYHLFDTQWPIYFCAGVSLNNHSIDLINRLHMSDTI